MNGRLENQDEARRTRQALSKLTGLPTFSGEEPPESSLSGRSTRKSLEVQTW